MFYWVDHHWGPLSHNVSGNSGRSRLEHISVTSSKWKNGLYFHQISICSWWKTLPRSINSLGLWAYPKKGQVCPCARTVSTDRVRGVQSKKPLGSRCKCWVNMTELWAAWLCYKMWTSQIYSNFVSFHYPISSLLSRTCNRAHSENVGIKCWI